MNVSQILDDLAAGNNIPILLVGLVSVCLVIVILNLFYVIKKQQNRAKLRRKVQVGEHDQYPSLYSVGGASVDYDQETDKVKRFVGRLGEKISDKDEKRQSYERLRFLQAGYRSSNIKNIFWGVKLLLMVGLVLLGILLVSSNLLTTQTLPVKLVVVLVLAFIGFYLPDAVLKLKISSRKSQIVEGFPDALDLLVVCVEAGLGLESAIHRVAGEMKYKNKPLSDEFELFNLEISAGKFRRDALRDMGERINAEDVNSLVTLLIQTDQLGTSVAKAMRVYSDTFRTKRYMRAEEKAAKLTVKLVIPLILFIFPSIFVVLMGPAAIRIFEIFANK